MNVTIDLVSEKYDELVGVLENIQPITPNDHLWEDSAHGPIGQFSTETETIGFALALVRNKLDEHTEDDEMDGIVLEVSFELEQNHLDILFTYKSYEQSGSVSFPVSCAKAQDGLFIVFGDEDDRIEAGN